MQRGFISEALRRVRLAWSVLWDGEPTIRHIWEVPTKEPKLDFLGFIAIVDLPLAILMSWYLYMISQLPAGTPWQITLVQSFVGLICAVLVTAGILLGLYFIYRNLRKNGWVK